MTKQVEKIRPIGAKPTKEEQEAQAKRAFLQKRASLVEIILSNSLRGGVPCERITVHGDGRESRSLDFKPAVDAAIDAADYLMEKLYGVAVTTEE